MKDERTQNEVNDLSRAYQLHSDLGEFVKQHDIVTDQVWGTAISGEYESGQLISETCEIRITVSVSMDEPAWKVLSFEDI